MQAGKRKVRIITVASMFLASQIRSIARSGVILHKSNSANYTLNAPNSTQYTTATWQNNLLSLWPMIGEHPYPYRSALFELPQTPQEIAQKYGIPETSRSTKCDASGLTTIGWVPSSTNHTRPPETYGRIPRLMFQSWKTNQLNQILCDHVLSWSSMNPEIDFFLFDDAAVDRFIQLEFGPEIFSSYACVKVGAAKCDVWRLMVMWLFGGLYFDLDTQPKVPFAEWNWGNASVVTGRGLNPKTCPERLGGCAHQWGLIYIPQHPVITAALLETLFNLAERKAKEVYDVSFWSYYNAWTKGPYNRSYMPGWGEDMGQRVKFCEEKVKKSMTKDNGHWPSAKQIWNPECL